MKKLKLDLKPKNILIAFALVVLVGGLGVHVIKRGSDYKDGIYKVQGSEFDAQGWKPFLEVTFDKGEVTEVNFDHINKDDGSLKSENDFYNTLMMSKVGMNPKIFVKEFAIELIIEQSPDEIDGVSGATHSADEFKVLAERIFDKAKTGDTKSETINLNH